MIDFASIWSLAAITLVVYILKYIIAKCRRDPRMVQLAETLPGPPGWPVIGNSMDFLREEKLKLMINYKKKYGDTYRLWLGKYLAVGLSNVDELEAVFMSSKMLGKPQLFQPLEDVFGDGVFTTRSIPKWRKNRKIFQPSFGRGALPRYTAIINDKANFMINAMKETGLVDGPEFDVADYVTNFATDAMLKLVFDIDVSWDDKSLVQFYTAAMRALEVSLKQICLPWLQYSVVNNLFYKKNALQCRNSILDFLRKLIESKKREILQQIEAHKNGSAGIPPKSVATLAYELGQMENDENVMLDELVTIMTAGGDPSIMMSFFLLAVAIHQDIQNKLYDELYEVFGDSDRPADANDLDRLPYLEQVLKETLRRFPIAPFLFREAEEDVKLGDRIIPRGTVIILSIAGVHFDPKHYPDPWKFNPDNFKPEVAEKRHKHAFLTFSAGLRNCMGVNFAMFEMKLAFIALLRNFSFHTKMKMEDVHTGKGFAMTSVAGYKLTISSRVKKPTYLNK